MIASVTGLKNSIKVIESIEINTTIIIPSGDRIKLLTLFNNRF